MIFFSITTNYYGENIKISLIFLQFRLFYLTLDPFTLKNSTVTPTILPLSMLSPIIILSFISLENFIVIIKPRTFSPSMHLTVTPTPFVFMIDPYQSSKTLDNIVFEISFINRAVNIFYRTLSVAQIRVKLSFILWSVLICGFPFAFEKTLLPWADILPFGRSPLIYTFSMRLIIMPFTFIAIPISRNQPTQALSFIVYEFSFVKITTRV